MVQFEIEYTIGRLMVEALSFYLHCSLQNLKTFIWNWMIDCDFICNVMNEGCDHMEFGTNIWKTQGWVWAPIDYNVQ
jgi:hypothetical protein